MIMCIMSAAFTDSISFVCGISAVLLCLSLQNNSNLIYLDGKQYTCHNGQRISLRQRLAALLVTVVSVLLPVKDNTVFRHCSGSIEK